MVRVHTSDQSVHSISDNRPLSHDNSLSSNQPHFEQVLQNSRPYRNSSRDENTSQHSEETFHTPLSSSSGSGPSSSSHGDPSISGVSLQGSLPSTAASAHAAAEADTKPHPKENNSIPKIFSKQDSESLMDYGDRLDKSLKPVSVPLGIATQLLGLANGGMSIDTFAKAQSKSDAQQPAQAQNPGQLFALSGPQMVQPASSSPADNFREGTEML